MIIQYASDLHLAFPLNYQYVTTKGLLPEGDVLVLAGDVADLFYLHRYDAFWDWCEEHFKHTIFVPGNHDYYGIWDNKEELVEPLNVKIRDNVLCCNNSVVRIDNIDFICSTLWSKVPPEVTMAVGSGLLDFRAIYFGDQRITVSDYNELHAAAFAFVQKSIEESQAGKKIVVTHHVPSFVAITDDFRDSPLASGFTTELGNWISNTNIDYWIYGHSHRSIEISIGQTKLLSNQLGYLTMGEGEGYLPNKAITI